MSTAERCRKWAVVCSHPMPDGLPIPWQAKIAAKIVLSRIPVGNAAWARLKLFRHGFMDDPEGVQRIFHQHFDRVALPSGFTMLELGPGNGVGSAMIAKALGASRSYLVDVGPFATHDVTAYNAIGDSLRRQGLDVPKFSSLENLLDSCSTTYLTEGLSSLRTVPSRSVDFVFSHAVLEHVRKAEMPAVLAELRRIQRGVGSHAVDLKDHLGGSLNNLRFREARWESKLFSESGFYTNRLRFSDLLRQFQDAGFRADVVAVNRWKEPPLSRDALAPEFRGISDDDLRVQDFDVLLH